MPVDYLGVIGASSRDRSPRSLPAASHEWTSERSSRCPLGAQTPKPTAWGADAVILAQRLPHPNLLRFGEDCEGQEAYIRVIHRDQLAGPLGGLHGRRRGRIRGAGSGASVDDQDQDDDDDGYEDQGSDAD
jgi:hypothetical protein